MSNRPDFLDLSGTQSSNPYGLRLPDLPSPRAGDVPPALSPLDAFALQSRMLARRFEQDSNTGKRISRLPQLDVANAFSRARPGCPRSASDYTPSPVESTQQSSDISATSAATESASGLGLELASPPFRPVSHYPLFGSIGHDEPVDDKESSMRTLQEEPEDYFAIPRTASPEPFEPVRKVHTPQQPPVYSEPAVARPSSRARQNSAPSEFQPSGVQRTLTQGTTSSTGGRSYISSKLAPPNSPRPQMQRDGSSIRSVLAGSDDDVDSHSLAESLHRSEMKRMPSDGSGFSNAYIPKSPFALPHRSPSTASEYSVGGSALAQSLMNFSRPMSRSGMVAPVPHHNPNHRGPAPIRKSSEDSYHSRSSFDSQRQGSGDSSIAGPNRDVSGTPVSITSEEHFPSTSPAIAEVVTAPSYVYAKYTLPRGRPISVSRHSADLRVSWLPQFSFDDLAKPSRTAPSTPTGLTTGSQHQRTVSDETRNSRPLITPLVPSSTFRSRSEDANTPSSAPAVQAPAGSPYPTSPGHPRQSPSIPSIQTVGSSSSNSTLKPLPSTPDTPIHGSKNRFSNVSRMTPIQHLDRGIAAHSAGSVNESTYHLRLAARAGLPEAMLLYALACRHGWGMRPNPEEAVQWLRKAVNESNLTVAEDFGDARRAAGGSAGAGAILSPPLSAQGKTHRAQLALSIYELGVSYMNGWGIGRDKPLALRCFEIASSWGDADAAAECGFCYAEGVGCRKDLKKAARFYRLAGERGVSMAGNSWIYKDKYNEPPPSHDHEDGGDEAERGRKVRKRGKSFGRRHGHGRESTEHDRAPAVQHTAPLQSPFPIQSPSSTYQAGASGPATEEESRKRDKSRTRNFWGRKKSTAVA